MPKKITDEETGEEVEVYTAEELEQQKQEALAEYKEQNPDKAGEIEALQKQLDEAKANLEKAAGKDQNFANLRKQKEEAEGKVDALKTEIDQKINLVKNEILEGVMKDHYNETLASLVGEDAELKKKVEFHYKRLQDTASTKAELSKKLTDAYVLATAPEDQGVGSTAFSSAGAGFGKPPSGEKKFTNEEKELARKLAEAGGMTLTDDDLK